jgi:hypothetical protein
MADVVLPVPVIGRESHPAARADGGTVAEDHEGRLAAEP